MSNIIHIFLKWITLKGRINFFLFIVFLLFLLLIYRLFDLQVLKGAEYRKIAADQYVNIVGDNLDRHGIYFKNKNNNFSPGAEMDIKYSIAIDPKTINNFYKKFSDENKKEKINNIYEKLYSVFEENNATSSFISKEDFLNKIEKNSSYELIINKVDEEIAEKISEMRIKGIVINKNKNRYYIESENAAKVLGFVGHSNTQNNKTGLYGLEKYYNDILTIKKEYNKNFFAEIFADLNKDLSQTGLNIDNDEKNISGDLNLTIDIEVQRFLHNSLKDIKDKWKSDNVGGIIMDINTGAIIAMDELPTFDPNNYSKVEDIKYYNNNLISGVYEMGSILKPLTIAAAIDSGVINEYTTYNDIGTIELNGYKISNFDKKARGPNTSIQTLLNKSLNVGIAFIVQKMGNERFSKYFNNYGFGKETGIDLPNENSGLVNNINSNITVDLVTAGFGQGIATTPIQTIRALATLGNGGKLINPHIVESISFPNGKIKKIIPDEPLQIFENASTSKIISKMLIHAVDIEMKKGNPKYAVAAKTGTAQLVNHATGKYYDDRYLHSFFGYFPAYNPKYIVFLYHIDPIGATYASETLKDSFFKIVNFLISYYEILPDRNGIIK